MAIVSTDEKPSNNSNNNDYDGDNNCRLQCNRKK